MHNSGQQQDQQTATSKKRNTVGFPSEHNFIKTVVSTYSNTYKRPIADPTRNNFRSFNN